MSFFRNTHITERLAAQLRVEAFDIFNHTQRRAEYDLGNSDLLSNLLHPSGRRRLQLGLTLTF
jgi:hypothetical protein